MQVSGAEFTAQPLRHLQRRAFDVAEAAKNAAIARKRFQDFTAAFAVVEKLAGIGWHGLNFAVPAFRAGQG